jgi:hypothetical protein
MARAADMQPAPAPAWASPSLALLGLEPVRAALEYMGARLMDRSALPSGDGHPVVIFPGLAADKSAIEPLKGCCLDLGYAAYDWGRGLNMGPRGDIEAWLDELAAHVQSVACLHERRVSLIGWSLGGIYAREIARKLPDAVRQVITLGSPFAGDGDATNVGWLYRLLSGQVPKVDEALSQRLRSTPPVPTTSIYSRSDGVVAWEACREAEGHPWAENIEVEASHIGLVWHPKVWAVVADRLSQPEGEWRPYRDPAEAANDAPVAAKVSARIGRLAA